MSQLILISHLTSASASIILYNSLSTSAPRTSAFGRLVDKTISFLPFFIQFFLGAILSGSLVFYSRSASLSISWPFLALLAVLIIGNEVFRSRYLSLAFQMVALFVSYFLYASFSLPLLLKNISGFAFIASGIVSLFAFYLITLVLKKAAYERYRASRLLIWFSVIGAYLLFNGLYFFNLIPPLPLSLREVGIYHSITKSEGVYTLSFEPSAWYKIGKVSSTFHISENHAPVYAFSSVFAPDNLSTNIVHEWFFFDPSSKSWVSMSKITFPISGGRELGYRGYTIEPDIIPGKWRLDVETEAGRLIGRTAFDVVLGAPVLELGTR